MRTWPMLAALACAAAAAPAFAQDFTVGQHVRIGSTGDTGVVIAVGQKMRDGGTFIQVQLDRLPPSKPPSGPWYDTAMSQVTVTGGGGGGGGGQGGGTAAAPPYRPAPPAPTPAYTQPQPPAAGVTGACQQAIRGNYPDPDEGTTNTVKFLSFSMAAPRPYEAIYGNDMVGAHGHTVQARPVHARYTVLTHYANPNSDDELRTYDAEFMCYQFPGSNEWIAGMVSRQPGGEEAQYIPKH